MFKAHKFNFMATAQSFGRATMSLHHLTLSKQDGKDKYDVTSDNYRNILKEYFNLDVKIKPLEA